MCFSHFHDFQLSCHIPGPVVFMSHFRRLSLFSPYSIFLQCVCLIFPVFLFSCHIQILQCTYLIFHVFHCFLSCSRSYHVSFSVFSLVTFLAIVKVLQCLPFIFHVFQFSHHNPGQTVFVFHFPCFSVFSP